MHDVFFYIATRTSYNGINICLDLYAWQWPQSGLTIYSLDEASTLRQFGLILPDGDNIAVHADGTCSIWQVAEAVAERLDKEPEDLHFIFKGKQLESSRQLDDYKVGMDVMHVMYRLFGC